MREVKVWERTDAQIKWLAQAAAEVEAEEAK